MDGGPIYEYGMLTTGEPASKKMHHGEKGRSPCDRSSRG